MKHLFAFGMLGMLVGLASGAARGQTAPGEESGPLVGWLRLSTEMPLRGTWRLYSEVETRQGNASLAGQHLGRVGLRWQPAPGFSLTSGYVLAFNAPQPGDAAQNLPEHRFYQEIALADVSGRLRVGHRLRAEERWLRPVPEAAFRFAPRLRYQLRLLVPLHAGGHLPVGACYAVAANELFAGLGAQPSGNLLEENRASAGIGCRISPALSAELVLLHQTQNASLQSAAASRNALQCSIAYAPVRPTGLVRR